MVRFLCAFLVLIAALPGAVIRGTIFENRSGKPLSRVLLTLQPVAGTSGTAASLHSDRFGGFSFQSLVPGTYVLKATRRGFLPLDYGQKLWNSSGQPIILTDDSPQSARTARLLELGARVVTTLLRLSALPLMRPARKVALELIHVVKGEPA